MIGHRQARASLLSFALVSLAGTPAATAGNIALHPAGVPDAQIVELRPGKLAKMKIVVVDGQNPPGLAKASKILLAPGRHLITLRGKQLVTTSASFRKDKHGNLARSSVSTAERDAEVTVIFEGMPGGRYRVSCTREGACAVADRNKTTAKQQSGR